MDGGFLGEKEGDCDPFVDQVLVLLLPGRYGFCRDLHRLAAGRSLLLLLLLNASDLSSPVLVLLFVVYRRGAVTTSPQS